MIVEHVQKLRFEVNKEEYEALEGKDDFYTAILDGRIRNISGEMQMFMDGELIDSETMNGEEAIEYVRKKDEA